MKKSVLMLALLTYGIFSTSSLISMESSYGIRNQEEKSFQTSIINETNQPITVRYRKTSTPNKVETKVVQQNEQVGLEYFISDPLTEVSFEMEGYPILSVDSNDIKIISKENGTTFRLTNLENRFKYELLIRFFSDEETQEQKKEPTISTAVPEQISKPTSPAQPKGPFSGFQTAQKPKIEPSTAQEPKKAPVEEQSSMAPFQSSIWMQGLAEQSTKPLITALQSSDDDLKSVIIEVTPYSNIFGNEELFFVGEGSRELLLSPVDLTKLPNGATVLFSLKFYSGLPSMMLQVSKEELMQKLDSMTGKVDLLVGRKGISFAPYTKKEVKTAPRRSSSSSEDYSFSDVEPFV